MDNLNRMTWKWKAVAVMASASLFVIVAANFIVRAGGAPLAPHNFNRHSYTLFESGPVRPLALSPSGRTLYAANTPDNRLEIFQVTEHGLRHRGSVSVGLEPVAVAAVSDEEVWVVNQLSDSVSIVEIADESDADEANASP